MHGFPAAGPVYARTAHRPPRDSSIVLRLRMRVHVQIAADVEKLGPFRTAADLEPVMCVLERWTRLLEFDLFHSQDTPAGHHKT